MFIKDGNLTLLSRAVLCITGPLLVFLGIYLKSILILTIGVVVGALGGYSSRAALLGLKPFGKASWRKAKDTYDPPDDRRNHS